MRISKRLVASGLGALLTVGVTTACSSVEVSPPITSCHSYKVHSRYGNFTIQQQAKGKSLQWGAYPSATYSGTRYTLKVYANGTKIDAKNQAYPPHGSVNAAKASKYSGKILKIAGNVTKGKDTVLVFNMQCRIM